MGVRKLWLAVIGFVQAGGLGESALAQGPRTFGDMFCQPGPAGAMCQDVGCLGQNPPFTHCENTIGTLDAFRCVPGGQPCRNDADCAPGLCRTVAVAVMEGCRCVDQEQPPVKCAVVNDQGHGGQLCADFNCRAMMAGFFCDPVTCNCVPEPAPTQTIPQTTTTSITFPTTTTTSSTTTTTLMVVDHLKCYKIKDSQKLRGVVDLDSPQFGLEPDCRIGKTKKFCVPVKKTVDSAAVNGLPFTPLPIAGLNLVDDYICYQIKCKTTAPPETRVEDQFGNRTVSKFKAYEVCTPARKVP